MTNASATKARGSYQAVRESDAQHLLPGIGAQFGDVPINMAASRLISSSSFAADVETACVETNAAGDAPMPSRDRVLLPDNVSHCSRHRDMSHG
jgi:hypothetical protein